MDSDKKTFSTLDAEASSTDTFDKETRSSNSLAFDSSALDKDSGQQEDAQLTGLHLRANISAEDQGEDYFQNPLRPSSMLEYVGQKRLLENIEIAIGAAKKRGDSLDHVLLHGPPGLGKTTLAAVIAKELGVSMKGTSGPVLERPGDLAAVLSSLSKGDVLFIDEIHRMNRVVEEILYPAMEDFQIDIVVGQGPSARSVKLDLEPFTLVGATTRTGLLTAPLRDRFGIIERLEYYSKDELATIVTRSAGLLEIEIDALGSEHIAGRSRGTPRIANRLLKRARDYAQQRADSKITPSVANDALNLLRIDAKGLDHMDRMILSTIINKFDGGPVGLSTLAASLSEEKTTLEDVYEPYLLQLGFIRRTPRGREVTQAAYEYLKS